MLRAKQGMPEEGEVLLCTVTKIYFNSVFVNIDEHNRSGMIHISEIAPGRIRNIADYVIEGKKVVCKVLRIDLEKGHVDLSLRRVNTMERRRKLDQIKQEHKAEKIIEFVASTLKKKPRELYDEIMRAVGDRYEDLHPLFVDIVTDEISLQDLIPGKTAVALEEVVRQRIKIPTVTIGGDFIIKSFAANGVELIRNVFKKAMKKSNEKTDLKYIGAGKYSIRINADDYKSAEKVLKDVSNIILKGFGKGDVAEFHRREIKE